MKLRKNNKGVAMVIALIAILFISVLASSLLYMTVLNNQMKTMRRYSTDNFYTAEYALDDMLSQLKQYASIQSDPLGELEAFLDSGDGSTLNFANVKSLIGVESMMPEVFDGTGSIDVDSIYSQSYVKTGNSIWMKGLRITVNTNEESGSLKSAIIMDVEIRFPESMSAGRGKLNDFSVLADSPMYIITSSQYFCGDLYCRANGNGTIGADNALRVGGDAIVNILSNFAFFDGDVKVDGTGTLFFGGTTYVNGDIYVDSTASLNIGGNLYVKGDIHGNYHQQSGANLNLHGGGGVDWQFYEDNYGDGLAGHLLADKVHVHLSPSTTANAPGGWTGTYYNCELTQDQFRSFITHDEDTSGRGKLTSTTAPDGRTISAIYETNGVQHNYENTLIICAAPLNNFHGTVKNCTVLNVNHNTNSILYIGNPQQWANGWGTMDDEAYEIAKNLLLCAETTNPDGHGMTFGIDGLSIDDVVSAGESDTSLYTAGGSNWKLYTGGGEQEAHYFYKVGAELNNIFPYKNLLSDEIDIRLGEFMYGTASDPTDPVSAMPEVFIYNWTKE